MNKFQNFPRCFLFLYFNLMIGLSNIYTQNEGDKIIGTWMNAANDMKVEVYKTNGIYQAKVVWFGCDPGFTMTDFYDKKNPNPALRTRPWLGMNVLEGLRFKQRNEWGNGKIYDPNSGHTYDSVCHLTNENTLKVRGYWLYEWMGKSLVFYRCGHEKVAMSK
jgi:uncharacterized protein (DUF2147 family)